VSRLAEPLPSWPGVRLSRCAAEQAPKLAATRLADAGGAGGSYDVVVAVGAALGSAPGTEPHCAVTSFPAVLGMIRDAVVAVAVLAVAVPLVLPVSLGVGVGGGEVVGVTVGAGEDGVVVGVFVGVTEGVGVALADGAGVLAAGDGAGVQAIAGSMLTIAFFPEAPGTAGGTLTPSGGIHSPWLAEATVPPATGAGPAREEAVAFAGLMPGRWADFSANTPTITTTTAEAASTGWSQAAADLKRHWRPRAVRGGGCWPPAPRAGRVSRRRPACRGCPACRVCPLAPPLRVKAVRNGPDSRCRTCPRATRPVSAGSSRTEYLIRWNRSDSVHPDTSELAGRGDCSR
jgi:hypothetical protein